MNPRLRNGIIIVVVGIGLIGIGIFVLGQIVRNLSPQPIEAQATPVTDTVLIVTHDLPVGTVIKSQDITQIQVPVEVAPRNALADPDIVIGKINISPLIAGEMVLSHHLADPTNINHDQAYLLENDQVLMAFQPDDLITELGLPQRGDVIDILVTITQEVLANTGSEESLAVGEEPETDTVDFTFSAFQYVNLTAVVFDIIKKDDDNNQNTISTLPDTVNNAEASSDLRSTDVDIHAYLLALSPQDALVLKHLQDTGAIFTVVIRAPNASNIFDLVPVSPEYLIDRYQLVDPRQER